MGKWMTGVCPYCEVSGAVWLDAEDAFQCAACARTFLRNASPEGSAAEGNAAVLRPRRAPGEGNPLRAALQAAGATVVFYAVLFLFPQSFLFELFAGRGWVPYVIAAISAWALCLLGGKVRRLRGESNVLELDLIGLKPGARLQPAQAPRLIAQIAARPPKVAESFLADRLIRTLSHFEARRRVTEVVDHLAAEARADDLRVDASYSLVRVFVWAIPTLGFIGTVLGIGGAVGGFSEALDAAASIDGMRESIGSVTSGLGVAFDTTLVALVMSILIMFPANAVQRMEEDLLSRVDDYCTQRLVQRLEDESLELGAGHEGLAAAVAAQIAERLGAAPSASEPGQSSA